MQRLKISGFKNYAREFRATLNFRIMCVLQILGFSFLSADIRRYYEAEGDGGKNFMALALWSFTNIKMRHVKYSVETMMFTFISVLASL